MSALRTFYLLVWVICLWVAVGVLLGATLGIEPRMAGWGVVLIAVLGGGTMFAYFLSK